MGLIILKKINCVFDIVGSKIVPIVEFHIVSEEKSPRAIIWIVPGFRKFRKQLKAAVEFHQRIEDIKIDPQGAGIVTIDPWKEPVRIFRDTNRQQLAVFLTVVLCLIDAA
jgi:hypothetical protein